MKHEEAKLERRRAERGLFGNARRRTIDLLRAVHGGEWRYEEHALGRWHQVSTGRRVERHAALDGGDDTFRTELRWLDTGEHAEWK